MRREQQPAVKNVGSCVLSAVYRFYYKCKQNSLEGSLRKLILAQVERQDGSAESSKKAVETEVGPRNLSMS